MRKSPKNRRRLSIDLDAYPDVKQMLEDAVKAKRSHFKGLVIPLI